MSTPHNNANKGDIAKKVIMPGDPLRAKWIADNFLKNVKVVSSVRGIEVFTGEYKNEIISVMASGMGMPSMMIYAWELFEDYDVDCIIRIGTSGGYLPKTKINDLVFSMSVSTDSNIQTHFNVPADWHFSPCANFELLSKAIEIAKIKKINYHVGPTVCTDGIYTLKNLEPDFYKEKIWSDLNVLCSDMETYALYACANFFDKKALAILNVVVNTTDRNGLDSEERETKLINMVEIALETCINI
ncbi:purine-nucleoside phosphorylase [Spiroplasma tabanidicola]|uniref:Uridine phosphorylase n=1 Tax=Spiroplasma tabanidicola TaxID=324079 RepID=A0A6I6CA73_9MOLU|nr:purine-nucleoside phosphorylase [Spiroplasma tabanidicola]QGS51811.1 purine-nucleoside phosphorylase [Spiroplasma tabanidicola]